MREEEKQDWKILDVNDLSDCPDILTGDYDFRWATKTGVTNILYAERSTIRDRVNVFDNDNIEYRLKTTPTKRLMRNWQENMLIVVNMIVRKIGIFLMIHS